MTAVTAEALRELASTGAEAAAKALGGLTGQGVSAGPAREAHGQPGLESGPWQTGVFFALRGDLPGVVALLLTPESRLALVQGLIGVVAPAASFAESALREVGNIVASQAVSAMVGEQGGRGIPSLPMLVMDDAEAAVGALVEWSSQAHYECMLTDRRSGLRALLVFAPGAELEDAELEAGIR